MRSTPGPARSRKVLTRAMSRSTSVPQDCPILIFMAVQPASAHPWTWSAPEQRGQGDVEHPCLEVPEGDVDGADGLHDQAAGAEVPAGAVHRGPAAGGVHDVPAGDRLGEVVGEYRRGGGGAGGPAQALLLPGMHGRGDRGGGVPGEGAVGLRFRGREPVHRNGGPVDGCPGAHGAPAGEGVSAWTCRVASRWAARAASAMMVSAGLAAPWVGSTLPSTMNRLGTPKTRWSASTTPSSGPVAIRAPPTRWAYRSMVMTSAAPAARRIVSIDCCAARISRRSLSVWV